MSPIRETPILRELEREKERVASTDSKIDCPQKAKTKDLWGLEFSV